MKSKIIDTNVIVRFLTLSPETAPRKFQVVFTFFNKLAEKVVLAYLPELVVFQVYFVLTSYYQVPSPLAAEKLSEIIRLSGIEMTDKALMLDCIETLKNQKLDLVDTYLCVLAKKRQDHDIFSYDKDFTKLGLKLAKIE